jgi:hypothetical protein
MKKNLSIIISTIILILCSCVSNSTISENYVPTLDFPIEKMNSSFIITDPAINNNSYKNDDILLLDLYNRSVNAIIFPGDFNLRIYQKVGTKWVPVKNNLAFSQGDWFLPTNQDWKAGIGLDLIPDISGLDKPTTIRIFAFGKTESTQEKVGAFIELTLYP